MSDTPIGRFCWYELMSKDPDATHDFYGGVVGWQAAPMEGLEMPYTLWMNGETPIGGLMKLPPEAEERGAPSHWLIYISTPDVDATTEKAKGLGAEVLTELDIPDVGKISVMMDPQGAVFAAYQPSGETPGHDGKANVGEVSWHELLTTDWQAAWSFYSELFGWTKDSHFDMGDMGIYHMFGRGSHALGGIMNRPKEMPVCAWLSYIRVPDVAAAVEQVKALGGQVFTEPMKTPDGDTIAHCFDPTGATIAFHSEAAEG
jgi:uncharacterized protein